MMMDRMPKMNLDVMPRSEVDHSGTKIAILSIIGIISAFALAFFAKLFFFGLEAPHGVDKVVENITQEGFIFSGPAFAIWYLLAAGIIFAIVYLLQVFFVQNLIQANAIIFFEAAVMVAAFYDHFSMLILATIAIMIVALIFGHYKARGAMDRSFKINFWQVSSEAASLAVLAFSIFITSIYLISVQAPGVLISENAFETVIQPVVVVTQKFYPGISMNASFSGLIETIAEAQIKSLDPTFKTLPPKLQKLAVSKVAEQFNLQFSNYIGTKIKPADRMIDVLYGVFLKMTDGFSPFVKNMIILSIWLTLFLFVKFLLGILFWFVKILAYLVYEILLTFNFATVTLEPVSKEVISLK